MSGAWDTLKDAGLPDGAIRQMPGGPLAQGRVRAAMSETAGNLRHLDPTRREPLLAWLAAWKHHWPERFREALGPVGDSCLAQLETEPIDANRYLKLRRIAIENLSHLL